MAQDDEVSTTTDGRITTTGHPADERAELARALARGRALHDVTGRLASDRTVRQMAETVLDGAELFAAPMAYVGTVDDDRTHLVMLATRGFDDQVRRYAEIPLDADSPGVEAIRTGKPVMIASRDEVAARFPSRVRVMERFGLHATAVQPVTIGDETVGCLALSYTAPRTLSEDERDLLGTLARLFGQAVERARAYERETGARAALERAMSRLARLQAVTAALGPQRRTDEIAETIVRETTQALGADAAGLFVPAGPLLEPIARMGDTSDWDGAERVAVDSPLAVSEAFREAHPVWVPTREEWRRRYRTAPPDFHADAEGVLAVPLVADGAVLGVLGLLFRRERALSKDERRLAATIGHQAAQAFERARLYDAERRAAEHTARLQEVAGGVAAAATPREVAEVVVGIGARAVGARSAAVGVVDADGVTIEVPARTTVPGDPIDVIDLASSTDRWPGSDAMAQRRPILIPDREELAARYPGVSPAVPRGGGDEGDAAWASLPMLTGAGAIGFVHFCFEGSRAFSEEEVLELRTMTAQATQAMDRARLFAVEHEVARVLQESLLPSEHVENDAFAVGTRYEPGADHLAVGGDWFEVVPLADGRLGIAVGDVVGRGLEAASAMGQMRSALRALAIAGGGPATVLEGLDRFAEQTSGAAMSTVVYGELDGTSGEFTYAAAGHLPPLLETDGLVEILDGGRSPLLAVGTRSPRGQATARLVPGATLVLYTDGLVERRGETIDLGIRRLERALRATADLDAEARCDAILERLLDGVERDDDVALLCVRRSGATRGRFSVGIDPHPSELQRVRRQLGDWLRRHRLADDEVASIVLAANEAVANAIEHGGGGDADVLIDATMRDGALTVEIRDRGGWRSRPSDPDRGRGLLLMQALMDTVEIERTNGGTVVRMRRGPASTHGDPSDVREREGKT